MPGIITQAVASTVLPYSLCSAFTEAYFWPVRVSGPYADGSIITNVQSGPESEKGRRGWTLQQKLTDSDRSTLETFRAARRGSTEAFYFYPKKSQYDGTGVSTAGRYLVRFDSPVSYTHGIVRSPTDFRLIQVQ